MDTRWGKAIGLKVLAQVLLAAAALALLPWTARAGDLDSPAAPDDAQCAMYTLEQI